LLVDEHDNVHRFEEIESYVASTNRYLTCVAEVWDGKIEEW